MSDLITNNYKYQKIKLDDGNYLDLKIRLPLPDSNSIKNDEKYLKAFMAESVETVNSFENKKHADLRIKAFNNFQNIAIVFKPTIFYLTLIIYKRFSKHVDSTKSFKENFIWRLKGLGCGLIFFYLSYKIYTIYLEILQEGRQEYLKELLGSQEKSVIEEYEKYKEHYAKSMENKKLI
jgi:hypothetical protein